MKTSDLRRWAVVGAQQRLAEIVNEQGAILAAFPELRTRGAKASPVADTEGPTTAKRQRRRRMSATARKRISEAQKARWAKQRAASSRGRTK